MVLSSSYDEFDRTPGRPRRQADLARSFRFLKEAFKLQQWAKELEDPENADPAVIDSLADFVVAFFGNKFTREELMDGAEMGEVMTIIAQIVSKIKSPNPNPPME